MFGWKGKRGQAAMEYLMTYGWAILVILIVIAVMYTMGIFNPKLPESCQLGPGSGLLCKQVKIAPNSYAIEIFNGNPESVGVSAIQCISNSFSGTTTYTAFGSTVTIGTQQSAVLSAVTACNAPSGELSPGMQFKGKIVVSYSRSGMTHNEVANVVKTVETA